jgi:hypothetical protein
VVPAETLSEASKARVDVVDMPALVKSLNRTVIPTDAPPLTVRVCWLYEAEVMSEGDPSEYENKLSTSWYERTSF